MSILDEARAKVAGNNRGASSRIAPQGLKVWVPFPVAVLPTPLRAFVEQASKAMGCDPTFLILPMLAVCGSLIGTTACLRLKRKWAEFPIIWSLTLAKSGTMKTPSFLLATEHLQKIQAKRYAEFVPQHEEWVREKDLFEQARKRAGKDSSTQRETLSQEPVLERLLVSDVTIEGLANVLKDAPRGVLLAVDEANGWLSGFERYSASSTLPHWLSLYNAQPLTVDRKGTGLLSIPRAAVSVCGGIQPQVFKRAMTRELKEAGLGARLLVAMPPQGLKVWTENEIPVEVERLWTDLIDGLLGLKHQGISGGLEPHTLVLSPEAKRLWVTFYNGGGLAQDEANDERAASLAKLEAIAPRLALIFAIVERVSSGADLFTPVDALSMEAAIEVAMWFLGERDRIDENLNQDDGMKTTIAQKLAGGLALAGPKGLNKTDLYDLVGRGTKKGELDEALQSLREGGTIERNQTQASDGNSRTELWRLKNPKILKS